MKKPLFILILIFLLSSSVLYSQSLTKTQSKDQSSKQDLQLITEKVTKEDSALTIANSLFAAEDYKAAKKVYQSILKKYNKTSLEAYAGLGKIAIEKKEWGEANDQFNKVLKLDNDNLEAYYYKGISYRESGTNKTLIPRKIDWNKSKKLFSFVMDKDSAFNDVLYQYAKLLQYRKKYKAAVKLAHTQVRLRPDLLEPKIKLHKFYKYFIKNNDVTDAIDWLTKQPWDQAEYFCGEKFRREGMIESADSVFQIMIKKPLKMSPQPVILSLCKMYYEQHELEIGQRFYNNAINLIKDDVGAQFIFEDLKYIFTDAELKKYNSLYFLNDKIVFLKEFWNKRDPVPAAKINVRLAEHYRRLLYSEKNYEYDGFRTKFTNPDKMNQLKFPKVYTLNDDFNDKGITYIRHGEPHDRRTTAGENVPPNESWLYNANHDTPKLMFHFMLENSTTFWRLTPVITNRAMLEDRMTWDKMYYKMLNATPNEQIIYENDMISENKITVKAGLSTDRHSWNDGIETFPIPYSMVTFRGYNGLTSWEFYSTYPVDLIAEKMRQPKKNIEFEKGITVHDKDWRLIKKANDNISLSIDNSKLFIDFYRFQVQPDSYNISYFSKPVNSRLLGGYRFKIDVEDYSLPKLNISDILLAKSIEPTTNKSSFMKNDLKIIPNTTHYYYLNDPVYIYFEVYNLNLNSDKQTNFSIEYTLKLLEDNSSRFKKLFSIFSRKKAAVSLNTVREGDNELSIEYMSIDVSESKPGKYELMVKITDKNTNNVIMKTTELNLM